MTEILQFDPALRQLLLRKTGSVSGEIPSEEIGAEEIPVVAKLVDPSVPVESLRIVAHFGQVVTARVPLGRIVEVRRHSNVASLKASRTYQADLAFSVPEIHASSETSNGLIGVEGFTGRGVIIGIVDWGCDFAHVNFRDKEDKSRIHYLWDQRGGRYSESPEPFGYGREFNREQINFALLQPDPYMALSYDPADADPMGIGTHCTHVMHIAAGNDRAPGSSPGVAPEAEFIVVHLKGEDVRSGGTLGDSVRVLEAVHYIFDKALEFNMPAVVNLSLGKTAGAHDGKTLVEQAFDNLLDEMPGRAIVMSAGNYFDTDMHASGQLKPGEYIDLQWLVAPVNDEITEMDIWYAGSDRFNVELIDPSGQNVARVVLADNMAVKNGERIIASIFHRQHDPTNGDNHIVIFLWPDAMLGTWTIRLLGEAVTNGSYHAWIERDNPMFQSRFARDCAVKTSTTGTIANGHKTIAIAAYDAREPSHPLAPFSSAGPTRDNRQKPDIAAPGVGILAARSSQPSDQGPRALNGLTTKSGTSMASPHVAGVIALMYQAAQEHRLTIDQTREILIKTVRSESLSGESELERLRYGAGRVNAAAAVKAVLLMKQAEHPSQDLSPLALSATLSKEYEEREIGESQLEDSDNAGGADSTDVMSIEKDSEGTMITSRANYEQSQNGTDFAWINRDDASLRSRLALILPCLLVEFGESELQRVDQYGNLIYDRCQPLTFGPTGEQYALTQGKYNYHAANFVYNTAYRLGYEVPVSPLYSASSRNGRSYKNTAATFAALAADPGVVDRDYFLRYFDVIVRPGQSGSPAIRPGDILLRGPEPEAPFGHIAIIVDPTLHDMRDPFFASHDALRGRGVQCIDAGLSIHRRENRYGQVLTDEQGKVFFTRMVLRFKEDAIDIPRVREQMKGDVSYRQMLDHTYRQMYAESSSSTSSGPGEAAESIGDGSPFLSQAVTQCVIEVQKLKSTVSRPSNPSFISAKRIRTESGVVADNQPYLGITREKLEAVIRAAYNSHQMPEVLLALWAKEGSNRMVTSARVVPQATTAQNAKALFRSQVYFEDLGADHFIVTTRPPGSKDNTWDPRDSAASSHETHFATQVGELVKSGLLSEDVTSAINAELVVSSSAPFSVQPTIKFYALSLQLMDALFTQMQRNSFPQVNSLSPALNYLQWNMGTEKFKLFLVSADKHRREPEFLSAGEPMALEQWALHTRPKSQEWVQARINAIRFMHYIQSFQPIFASSLNLIKPGIEELLLPSNVG